MPIHDMFSEGIRVCLACVMSLCCDCLLATIVVSTERIPGVRSADGPTSARTSVSTIVRDSMTAAQVDV